MASLANPYFPKGVSTEQALVQGLITESIQIMGHTVYYIPRNLQKLDKLFGEDILSKFVAALPIEMYIENFDRWMGEEELITKFGLEIRKQLVLSVSVPRWETEVQNIATQMWVSKRPQEGDLIYEPTSKMMLEIKFVEQDNPFYQLNKRYHYKLTCEMFQYTRDSTIETGIDEIDGQLLDSMSYYQLLGESGFIISLEQGGTLIYDQTVGPARLTGDAETFTSESSLLTWSANNPFGD
jgi:hypothetical protein